MQCRTQPPCSKIFGDQPEVAQRDPGACGLQGPFQTVTDMIVDQGLLAAFDRIFDGLQLLLVVSALVVDAVALSAISARISEFGFTPNRVAALGENLILLVNLGWTAWLYFRFMRHRGSFAALERWQIAYLPVYAIWAALVVVVFPPLFGYR